MLEVQGNSVTYYAHYTTDGVGETGLTVTITVYEILRDGSKTEIVTDGATVEIGDGLYRYILASGSVDAAADYIAVFHTATDTVDQQDIPAMWVIDRANLEDIADILTDTGTTLDGKLDTIDGNVDDILEDTGTTLPTAISNLNDITADNVLDATVEGTYSLKEVLRIMSGVLAGKLSGGGTTTLTFRDISDSLDRVVATVDSSGNRSAITITET